jgi:hypothetical protein
MKITINGKKVCELSEIQKKVIQNDIHTEIFEADMIRRLNWTIEHPCQRCYDRFKKSWYETIKNNGAKSACTEKMALAAEFFKYYPCDLPEGQDQHLSVAVDGKEVFKVTPLQKKILVHLGKKDPDEHCHSQMAWILAHKYERCMERLRREWEPKLLSMDISYFPLDDDDFAKLIFSQPNYKNRSQREKEEEVHRMRKYAISK